MTELTPGTRAGDDIGWSLDGSVLTLWLRRGESLNAVTAEMLDDLAELVTGAPQTAARVVVLRAEGRGFCSGADIGGEDDTEAGAPPSKTGTLDAGERLVRALTSSPLPIVSAVQGPCAGIGVPIALAADLTLASDKAFFMLAFTKIGLMPDGGATAIVAASVGRAIALRMALLAERLTADQAVAAGLIASVTPADDFAGHVDEIVQRLAAGPSRAYAETTAAINAATLGSLDAAFAVERARQIELLEAHDFAEGTAAFREKRDAVFTDR